MSAYTLCLEVGEKIPGMPQNEGLNSWRVYIIFTSSHTIYLEVGEKNTRIATKGGYLI